MKIIIPPSLIAVSCTLKGQYSFKGYIKDGLLGKPLEHATVNLKGTSKSAIADSTGLVILNGIPAGDQVLVFSYVGLKERVQSFTFPLNIKDTVEILLEEGEDELDEVTVQTTRSSRTIKNIPTRIEVITGEELQEKSTMKPGDIKMLLNESTGIATQQTSAVSGSANIRIQGLDGRYTQLLNDGMPLYQGYSGGLSIMQISPLI